MITRQIIGVSRHMRDAVRNFFRNFGLSLSALASINVTLIVVSLAILVGYNFDSFTSKIESEVTAVAYISNDVAEEDIEKLEKNLRNDDRIDTVEYSNKEEELALAAENLDGFSEIASQYEGDENPLYRVFYLKAKDVNDLDGLTKDMMKTGNYFEVKYAASVVDKIVKLFDYARILAVVIIGLLLLVTVFIIYNTIRITIYTRSVQVDIMKLIGASNYHITMPYVYEGMLIGFFGSLLPIIITIVGYKMFYDEYADNAFIKSFFDLAEPYPLTFIIAGGTLLVGLVVGVFGSVLSIRRFVRK